MAVSSRSYQSQTFRRLMAGYGRLSSWGRKQLNTLTLAASWSLQVLVYPLYVGFQSTRLVYRRLRTRSIGRGNGRWQHLFTGARPEQPGDRPAALAAEAPAPDAPIRYLMATLQGSAPRTLAPAIKSQIPLPLARRVRGVACTLADRSLSLVDAQGQGLALTASQRDYLQQLMIWVLADYAYRWYRYRQRQQLRLPLPPATPHPLAWRPVRQVYRLMGWMQQAGVATAINLFQESYWVSTPLVLPSKLPSAIDRMPLPKPLAIVWRSQNSPLLPQDPAADAELFQRSPPELLPSEAPPTSVSPSLALTDSNWIDTQAVLVGYVDHPLVAVLRWLDQALLWLEAKARNFWRQLRS